MKRADIVVGKTYANGRMRRTVTGYDGDFVIYTDHISERDFPYCSCRVATFAAWAKEEVTGDPRTTPGTRR